MAHNAAHIFALLEPLHRRIYIHSARADFVQSISQFLKIQETYSKSGGFLMVKWFREQFSEDVDFLGYRESHDRSQALIG